MMNVLRRKEAETRMGSSVCARYSERSKRKRRCWEEENQLVNMQISVEFAHSHANHSPGVHRELGGERCEEGANSSTSRSLEDIS